MINFTLFPFLLGNEWNGQSPASDASSSSSSSNQSWGKDTLAAPFNYSILDLFLPVPEGNTEDTRMREAPANGEEEEDDEALMTAEEWEGLEPGTWFGGWVAQTGRYACRILGSRIWTDLTGLLRPRADGRRDRRVLPNYYVSRSWVSLVLPQLLIT